MKQSITHQLKQSDLKNYLQQHQIKHIWLTGSVARGEATADSDIDVIYEFDAHQIMKDWGIVSAKVFLENHFKRSVDLLDKEYLPKSLQSFLLSDSVKIW